VGGLTLLSAIVRKPLSLHLVVRMPLSHNEEYAVDAAA